MLPHTPAARRLFVLAWPLTLLLLPLVPESSRAPTAHASSEAAPFRVPPAAMKQRAEHLMRLGVSPWHASGHRGKGVKVAILDTGWQGWRDHLGRGLPARVTARSFRDDGDLEARESQHGILCAEVIHAIAPEAELFFANWEYGRADQFLAAVRWAKEQGCRVISCSVVTPSWSDGEGGGLIHRQLSEILGPGTNPGDVLLFASAGNTADRHWGGRFRDGGDGWHPWADGQLDNGLRPWGQDTVMVELYARPGTDYELVVYDSETGREAGRANSRGRTDRTSTLVLFTPEEGHTYRVRVRKLGGPGGHFHLTTTFGSIDCAVPASNVCFPADGLNVVAVGAVDAKNQRMWYSACGPNSPRPKPDFVAPVPFASAVRERAFGGTSCAAPQAASLAALWFARHREWSPEQVRAALRRSVLDLGPPGHDFETGYGLLRLPRG